MLKKIQTRLQQPYTVLSIFVLMAIVASLQRLKLGPKEIGGQMATHYNNFIIFKNSFYHLFNHQNLYLWYPAEQYDQFKYTPTFAAFFSLFTYFDTWTSLNLWNILNVVVLFMAIYALPMPSLNNKAKIAFFILIEMITSLQSQQVNPLNVGLIVLGFANMERKNYFWAVFCIVCTFYTKIYGISAAVIWFFYDNKIKNLAYGVFWLVVLGLVPMIFVDFSQLQWQYQNYLQLIEEDHAISYGLSVINVCRKWLGWEANKVAMIAFGLFATLSPLLWVKRYDNPLFRYLFMGNFLIFLIIFNHKAESPTFIVAAVGVAMWYFAQKENTFNLVLIILTFLFAWLAPTDIYPRYVREHFFEAYSIKVVPCFLVWCKAMYDLHIGFDKIEARV
jgi:Glycosyltransferase family 87